MPPPDTGRPASDVPRNGTDSCVTYRALFGWGGSTLCAAIAVALGIHELHTSRIHAGAAPLDFVERVKADLEADLQAIEGRTTVRFEEIRDDLRALDEKLDRIQESVITLRRD